VFIRKKRIPARTREGGTKEYSYYYLVENYWENGKTRQRDIAYLGKEPAINAQQINALGLNRKALEQVRGLWIKEGQGDTSERSEELSQRLEWDKVS
jgi:hypothetical protein